MKPIKPAVLVNTLLFGASSLFFQSQILAQESAEETADEIASDVSEQQANEVEAVVDQSAKSFDDALDEIEKEKGSLLTDGEGSPYLFEYEYEYEYDSNYTTGFKPKSEAGEAAAGAVAQEGTDRIEQAGQDLVDASLLAPKSRVREQFVKLGGESISTIGLHSFNDLIGSGVRGLLIQPNEFSSSTLDLTLRGVSGTNVDQVTGESGVGIFVDGVPVLRGQAFGLGLLDLESMDMLRGSRGVVSGRNAAGGAIYLNSRKPSGEFGLRQQVRLGFAFDDVQSITNIDLPAVSGLPMTRLSYLSSQHDGWVENIPGPAANDMPVRDNTAWRVAMTVVPSDRFSADFSVERSELESTPHYFQAIEAGPTLPLTAQRNRRESVRSVTALPLSKTDQTAVTLNTSFALNERYELKTIFGWNELEDISYVNFESSLGTGGALGPLAQGVNSLESFDNTVLYGELQLNGKALGDLLNFSTGIALTEDDSEYNGNLAVGAADLRSISFYLQTVWALTEKVSLTVGYRSTDDEKDFSRTAFFADPDIANNLGTLQDAVPPGRTLQGLSPDEFDTLVAGLSPALQAEIDTDNGADLNNRTVLLEDSVDDFTIAADFDITKQLTTYASWSTGYKAGGASLFANWGDSRATDIYRPEKTTTIQAGIKGNLLDSKIYFDAALFTNDIDNRQIVLANPSNRRVTNIINAADTTTISGLELDLRWKATEALRFGAFLTFLDADDNTVPPVFSRLGSGSSLYYDYTPQTPEGAAQTAFVERAPDTSISLTADYKFGLGQSRDSVFRLEYVNTSGYKYDAFTNYEESRTLLNARLLFSGFELEGADDGKIEISIWGENLLDEDYIVNALAVDSDPLQAPDSSYTSAAFGEPLTYGIDIDFVF